MKTVNFRNILVGILCSLSLSLSAQNASPVEEPEEETPNTLTEQFLELKKKSNSYKEYKVVKEIWLNGLWANIQDSLATVKQDLRETQAKVEAQNQKIQQLNESMAAKDKAVQDSEHASTHINVLGMEVLKGSFLTFFWVSVSILGLLLALALYQYKRSNQVSAKTRKDYHSLQHELEDVRKTSLERERKLRRELQTERNLVEELRTTTGQKDKSRFY